MLRSMKPKLSVIYIPGLGDARVHGQRLAVCTWRLWGVHAEVFQVLWADDELWENKLRRLLGRIDVLAAKNNAVALVGSSAGASAVINAYARRTSHIAGCVLIAGKVNRAAAIGEQYRKENPAFLPSAQQCERSLASLDDAARRRVLSRYGIVDHIVPKEDSYVAGAHNQAVPTFGHVFTIGVQLIVGAPSLLRFLKAAN